MHEFEDDFYGEEMRVVVVGYIRDELNYTTKEALVKDIRTDIDVARKSLNRPTYQCFIDLLNKQSCLIYS